MTLEMRRVIERLGTVRALVRSVSRVRLHVVVVRRRVCEPEQFKEKEFFCHLFIGSLQCFNLNVQCDLQQPSPTRINFQM